MCFCSGLTEETKFSHIFLLRKLPNLKKNIFQFYKQLALQKKLCWVSEKGKTKFKPIIENFHYRSGLTERILLPVFYRWNNWSHKKNIFFLNLLTNFIWKKYLCCLEKEIGHNSVWLKFLLFSVPDWRKGFFWKYFLENKTYKVKCFFNWIYSQMALK